MSGPSHAAGVAADGAMAQPGTGGSGEATLEIEKKPPLLEDVMQLARLGEIELIQKLFENGKIGADFRDKEGITPLHVGRHRGG
jgi:hypothetical protein